MTPLQLLLDHLQNVSDAFASRLGPTGDWRPMLFVVAGEGEGTLHTALLDGFEESTRDAFYAQHLPSAAHDLAGGESIQLVVYLASAWMLSLPADEGPPDVRPTDHPDRIEILSLLGVSADEEINRLAAIIRDGRGVRLDWDSYATQPGDETSLEGPGVAALRRAVWQ